MTGRQSIVSDGVCVHCAHDPRKTPKQRTRGTR